MLESSELLRSYLRGLCEVTGARGASLYIPAVPGTRFRGALLHHGDGPAVTELATVAKAERLAKERRDAEDTVFESEDSDALLVSLPPAPSAWSMMSGRSAPQRKARRNRRREVTSKPRLPRVWLGLRLVPPAVASEAPAVIPRWLLDLGSRIVAQTAQARSALIDPVTELPGRLGFEALLREELHYSRAVERPLALLLVNPADFSAVNEEQGPRAGDAVLSELALLLSSSLRVTDALSRFGGAIFAAVLPATGADDARLVADRLVETCAEADFLDGEVQLDLQIGFVACEGRDLPEHAVELIRRADLALNAARTALHAVEQWSPSKRGGRPGPQAAGVISSGDLSRDYRNIALLRDTIRIGASGADFTVIAEEVLERIFSAVRPDRLGLFSVDDEGGPPRLLHGLVRSPGKRRRPVGRLDLTPDARAILADTAREGRRGQGIGSGASPTLLWTLPVSIGDRLLGALYVEGQPESLEVGPEDLLILDAVATHLATAMDSAQLESRDAAVRDRDTRELVGRLEQLRGARQATDLVFRSDQMASVVREAERLAATNSPVLLSGPDGVGKASLARYLHARGPRRDRDLIEFDCEGLPPTVIEAELFGNGPDVYRGARPHAVGLLVEADLGTLFLAEVSALPADVQRRLVEFLREPTVRVGSDSESRRLDVRVLAATSRPVEEAVAAGLLLEELAGHLGLLQIEIPPLRERPTDIPALAAHFLEAFGRQYERTTLEITPEAADALEAHDWPGNVRELRNRLLQAILGSHRPRIEPEDLGLPGRATTAPTPASPEPAERPIREVREELRRELRRQLETVERSKAGPMPMGRWLIDDLIQEADTMVGGVARQGALRVGLPETTYRRRLGQAAERGRAGLAPRTADWHRVRRILFDLVRASGVEGDLSLVDLAEQTLLHEILDLHPRNEGRASRLLGVTEPTLRRRVTRLLAS